MNLKLLKHFIYDINKKPELGTIIYDKHFHDYENYKETGDKTYIRLVRTDYSYKIFDILVNAVFDDKITLISDTLLILGLRFIKSPHLIEYIICKEKSANYSLYHIYKKNISAISLLTKFYTEWEIPTDLYKKYFNLLVSYKGTNNINVSANLFLVDNYGNSDLLSLLVYKRNYDEAYILLKNKIINLNGPQNIGCIDIMEITDSFNCNFIQNLSKYTNNIHYIMRYKRTFKFLLTQKNFADIVHYLFLMNFKIEHINLSKIIKKTSSYISRKYIVHTKERQECLNMIFKNIVIMANYIIKNLNNIDIKINDLIQIIYISDLCLENYLNDIKNKIKNMYYGMNDMLVYYIFMYDAINYDELKDKLNSDKNVNYNGLFIRINTFDSELYVNNKLYVNTELNIDNEGYVNNDSELSVNSNVNNKFISYNEYGNCFHKIKNNYICYKEIADIILENAKYIKLSKKLENRGFHPVGYGCNYKNYNFNNYENVSTRYISSIINIHNIDNLEKLDEYQIIPRKISNIFVLDILYYCTPEQIELFIIYFNIDCSKIDMENFRFMFNLFITYRLNNNKFEYFIDFCNKYLKINLYNAKNDFNTFIINNDNSHPLKNFITILRDYKNNIDYYDDIYKKSNVEYINFYDLLCTLYKLGFKFNMNSNRAAFWTILELIPDYRIIELFLKNVGVVSFGLNLFGGCLYIILIDNTNLVKLKNHNKVPENISEKLDIIKLLYQHPKLSLKKEYKVNSNQTALYTLQSFTGNEEYNIIQYIIIHTFGRSGIINYDTYVFKNANIRNIFKLYDYNKIDITNNKSRMTYGNNNKIVSMQEVLESTAKLYGINVNKKNILIHMMDMFEVYPEILTLKDMLIIFIKTKIYNKKVYYGKIPLTVKGVPYKKYKEHVAIPDDFPYVLLMRSNK